MKKNYSHSNSTDKASEIQFWERLCWQLVLLIPDLFVNTLGNV